MKKKKIISLIICFFVIMSINISPVLAQGNTEVEFNRIIMPRANYYIVTASTLNVRSGSGLNYEVIGQLHKGDKVLRDPDVSSVTADGYTWVKIWNEGSIYGWVASRYISNIS